MKISHPWSSALVESVKRLYPVFSSYQAEPSSIGICPNCISEHELEALFAKPLRILDAATIYHFAIVAVATHGSVSDFKHFLPRVCELFPNELCDMDSPEFYLNKLRYSDWLGWPEEEMLAVRAFMLEWWRWTLTNYPAKLPVWDAICAIAQAEDDLLPYLEAWDSQCGNGWTALRQLVDFYQHDLIVHGRQNRLSLGSFWEERSRQEAQVCCWLLREETRRHIERAAHEYATKWHAEQEIAHILIHHDVWRNKQPS